MVDAIELAPKSHPALARAYMGMAATRPL